MPNASPRPDSLVATGVTGFDDVLGGGLTPNRLYLVEGDPGSGKTTLALQFLLEGAKGGERGLYVTLSETKEELEGVARSHGWSLDAFDVCELIPS
jgi:circadian clock protein KaiC